MCELRDDGVRRVLFADWGKNVFAYFRAAGRAGIETVAVADDRFAGPGRRYRGLEILSWERACERAFDAIVVANSSEVHGTATRERLRGESAWPVHNWFQPPAASSEPALPSSAESRLADEPDACALEAAKS
jgi:hypothetical protein